MTLKQTLDAIRGYERMSDVHNITCRWVIGEVDSKTATAEIKTALRKKRGKDTRG